MIMQKTITTVVDPIVSALVGKEIFLISPRTSVINSTTDAHSFLNTVSVRSAPSGVATGTPPRR